MGPNTPPRKFYLIANRQFESRQEWTAIPVTGECELASGEPLQAGGKLPEYVTGLLSLDHETIEVLDLEKLIDMETTV